MRNNSANLDLLRSLAVLTVMIDHLVPTLVHHGVLLPWWVAVATEHIGQAGVLAFFVHTSLVLMYSLERLSAPPRTSWVSLRFYLRRAFRIYPLAVVCILGVVLLDLPPATWRTSQPITSEVLVANLLLVQNLFGHQSVLAPLWSLPYEVEMYLALPALYYLARRSDSARWLSALLAVLYVTGYAIARFEGHLNMAAYVPCFLSGVLCYALRDRIRPLLPGGLWWVAVVALIALYAAAHWNVDHPVYWVGWVYCLVLGLAINAFDDSRAVWLNRLTQRIATYSYGIYLLHVPVLFLIFSVWAPSSTVLAVACFFALTGLAAIVAFYLVESPMINLGRRLTESPPP